VFTIEYEHRNKRERTFQENNPERPGMHLARGASFAKTGPFCRASSYHMSSQKQGNDAHPKPLRSTMTNVPSIRFPAATDEAGRTSRVSESALTRKACQNRSGLTPL
jgi:hypothetical protein